MKTLWLNIGYLDRDMELGARQQILRALADQKVKVQAAFNFIQTPSRVYGLDKIWLLRRRSNGCLGTILLFAQQQLLLMKNLDTDVVVVWPPNLHHTLPLWFIWRIVLRRNRPKFVLDVRTLPVDATDNLQGKLRQKRFDSSVRIAFKFFDGLTVITKRMRSNLQKKANNFKKEICVWSSGVDTDLFDPTNVADIEGELKFSDRYVIMYHGIFSPNRGLQQTIEAIDIVRKNHPEIMLLLLGKGSAQSELEEMVRRLELQNHVLIHPQVPYENVPKYINSVQAGILPFPNLDWWSTSSPIKLCEYLAMGKPVIVTDIAAHRAVLGKLKCGFFIPNHEPASIARGINSAIEKVSDLKELGKVARTIIIDHFTWKRQALKIKGYFTDILKDEPFTSP